MKHDGLDAALEAKAMERRIREHRTAEATLILKDAAGRPLAGAECSLALARHEFRLGANAFLLSRLESPRLQDTYDSRFAGLLNYATLPFYWSSYEPKKGKPQERRLRAMAEWCRRNRIVAKGHPLAWHEAFPEWAKALPDREVLARLKTRVHELVSEFRGLVDVWDVFNETTVSHQFDNAVGRWVARRGAADCVSRALAWAHSVNPRATLLYNDFNVSDDFEALAASLLASHAPVDVFGIQSHMHKATWPLSRLWQVCEAYGRFGLPLHFTEATVLSGRPKAEDDNDWHRVHTDWPTTSKGETAQLKYGRAFYTILFSHPAVEAVTWWDMSDLHSWQGAPSGLIRRDMTPKPLYNWLLDSFQKRWTTRVKAVSDKDGRVTFRGFFGDYDLHLRLASGRTCNGAFSLRRRGVRRIGVTV